MITVSIRGGYMKSRTAPMFKASLTMAAALLAAPVFGKTIYLVNSIGPQTSGIFLANADGSGEHPLLTDTKREYDASFSADGQWVVFTSERNGPANIYRAHVDGSDLEQLTNNNGFDDQGVLSPDGKQLAFVSTRDGGFANIWLLDLNTHKLRNLTGKLPVTPGLQHAYLRPSWSPDGQWLAFSSDRNTQLEDHKIPQPGWEHLQRSSVYILRIDGTGLKRLSDDTEAAGSPKWSRDGKQVIFYSLPADKTFAVRAIGIGLAERTPDDVNSQLISVDIATGTRTQHLAPPGVNVSPQFIGNGRIGYLRKGRGFEAGKLAWSDQAENHVIEAGAVPGDLRNPAWSPDGKSIVYHKYQSYAFKQGQLLYSPDPNIELRFSGEFPAISSQGRVALSPFPHDLAESPDVPIYLADVDGSHMEKIYQIKNGWVMSPTWSPNGKQLVAVKATADVYSPMQLVLLSADGSLVRTLTDGKLSSSFPSFAPDGKHVVYRLKGQGLRILNIEDGSSQTLTTAADNFPFWSPDGSRICFTRNVGGVRAFDIFTIRPDGSDLKPLTTSAGNDSHCAWTSDSRSIVFSSSRLGFRDEAALYDRGAAQPYAELFMSNVDGSNQHPITDDKWEQGTPAAVPPQH